MLQFIFSKRLPWSDQSGFHLEVFLVTMTLLSGLVFGVVTYNIIDRYRYCNSITIYFPITKCNRDDKLCRNLYNSLVLYSTKKANHKEAVLVMSEFILL